MLNVRSVRLGNRTNIRLGGVASQASQLKHSSRRLGLPARTRRTRKTPAESRNFTNLQFSTVKEPNQATLEAIAELEQGRGVRFNSVKDLIRDLGI